MLSNKRRRNEIGTINDTNLIDRLDNYPYLLRSIQAGEYMVENPIVLDESRVYNNSEIITIVKGYFINIINIFFSGCGLYYEKDDYLAEEDDRIDMYISTPLPESQFNLNFAIFNGQFENMCRKSFDSQKYKYEVSCRGEISLIWMNFRILKDEDKDDRIYDYNFIPTKDPLTTINI